MAVHFSRVALAPCPAILLALATVTILPADSVGVYAYGVPGGPYSNCQQNGTTAVTAACSYQQSGFSVSMAGQIQQGYGSISATGHVAVDDVPYVFDTYDGDAYYLGMGSNYEDHLYVPGSGQAEVIFHFTGTGGINSATFSCLNSCNILNEGLTSFGLGGGNYNVAVFFTAGTGTGAGLDFKFRFRALRVSISMQLVTAGSTTGGRN